MSHFDVWLNLYFVYKIGRTPDNVGQVLKDLLVDNNVDITKCVSCKHKQSKLAKDIFEKIKKCTRFQLPGEKNSSNYAIPYFYQSTEFEMVLT